jgi:lipopolysaccharide/colanic/teichoic acid biosynthesis glycosyltransferase
VATSPQYPFNPDPRSSRVDVRVRSGFEVLPTAKRQDAAVGFTLEENHLGHPRFARMTSQGSELRRAGSIRLSFLVTDLAVSIVNLFLVSYVREAFTWLPASLGSMVARHPYIGTKGEFLALLSLYSTLTILSCRTFGLYDTREPRPLIERGWSMLQAITLSTGLLAIFAWVSRLAMMSPLVVTGAGVLNLISFTGWRLWHRHSSTRRVMEKKQARNVLIIGGDHVANRVADALHRNPHLGYAVAGLVKINGNGNENGSSNGNGHSNGNGNGNGNGNVNGYSHFEPGAHGEHLTLGSLDELSRIARAHFVDEILIAPPVSQDLVRQVLSQAHRNRLDVKIVPELYQEIALHSLTDFMGGIPVMSLHREPIPENKLFIKRVIDIALSSIALLVASPVLALIAIAIKLDSRGPAFYCAPRVGKKGRKFTFYKFRTMVVDAEQQKERLRALNQRSGPFFKIQNDPRITRVGLWLRKFSLDELPQLWNVLKGDMSMVGPRPHPLDDFAQYQLEDLRRLDVLPGITGLWQVSARKDPSFDKNLALDLEYIDNWSPLQDFKILLQTVPAVLRAQGD